jgi:hypothetical protein
MANLHSLGQAITIYANENQDRLVPGDSPRSTAIWGKPTDALEGECGGPAGSRPVNLGHLVKAGTPPLPTGKETVLFCPSTRLAYGFTPPGEVPQQWGTDGTACISYVYDDALDGFGCDVCDSVKSLPLHKNTINFVRADGSVQAFRMQRVVFEEAIGSETVQEIMTRYVVCFPTAMIFRWLEQDAVDVVAARAFLSDPLDWYAKNSAATPRRMVHLADVANKPLVCDAIGHPVAASDLPNSGHG